MAVPTASPRRTDLAAASQGPFCHAFSAHILQLRPACLKFLATRLRKTVAQRLLTFRPNRLFELEVLFSLTDRFRSPRRSLLVKKDSRTRLGVPDEEKFSLFGTKNRFDFCPFEANGGHLLERQVVAVVAKAAPPLLA